MLLGDYGADVVRVDRITPSFGPIDTLCRRKRSVIIDLKTSSSHAAFLALADAADILIDPFRPNVLERLGVGPNVLCARNPKLIYARLTGFRRDGLYADRGGHDINYLAVCGVLSLLGRKETKPTPPVNLLADFAGGGAVCALGVLFAVIHRMKTGHGQVVESNMVDGTAYLATMARQHLVAPALNRPRGENLLDGACPYYETYETSDGKFIAVGAMAPKFYDILTDGLGFRRDELPDRDVRDNWPLIKDIFTRRFRQRTREEWRQVFDSVDACVTPVLHMWETEVPQRPLVGLSESPSLDVESQDAFPILKPGDGSQDVIDTWLGEQRNILKIDNKTMAIHLVSDRARL